MELCLYNDVYITQCYPPIRDFYLFVLFTTIFRNSDSGASSSVAKVREDDAFEAKTRKTRSFKDWEAETKGKKGKGKSLTDRLVSDGLLTDKMVKDLHREFAKERKKSGKQKLIDDRE